MPLSGTGWIQVKVGDDPLEDAERMAAIRAAQYGAQVLLLEEGGHPVFVFRPDPGDVDRALVGTGSPPRTRVTNW